MNAANAHIQREFEEGRIVGADFPQIYLGGMQAVLAQATDFLLRKDLMYFSNVNAELQGELLKAQKLLIERQILALDEQSPLIAAQIRNLDAQTDITIDRGGFR